MNKYCYVDLLGYACIEYARLPALHIKRQGRYETWTFAGFRRDCNRLSSVLGRHGLGKGQCAAVIGENSPEWVIAYHAILLTGACTVPIDPGIPAEEIETIVSVTGTEIVFCSPLYEGIFRSIGRKRASLKKIVSFGDKPAEDCERYRQFIDQGDERHDAFSGDFHPDDPMVIIFTSGTTGAPKGVVLAQRNFTPVANYAIPRMKLGAGDTVLAVLPLHHVFGFAAGVSGPLCGGMAVVFVPAISAPLILEALRDKGITMLPAVPKMVRLFYESVIHNVKKKGAAAGIAFSSMQGVSSLLGSAGTGAQRLRKRIFSAVHKGLGGRIKVIISGGASLNKKYWNGFRLLGFNIVEGYGLTETFGPITVCPADDARPLSVGPVLPQNEITVLHPNEEGIGEVLVRGACVFLGYYKNDALTREAFDENGWFHTGDLGRIDRDGFLYISGRKKDVIVLDTGKNVYPDDLESFYEQSPLIEEIGIFGVVQEEGEAVAAAIVPCEEIRMNNTIAQATALLCDEVLRMAKTLPVYRRIADFVVVYQPLPRTTTRKLKKKDLLGLYSSIKRSAHGRLDLDDQLSVVELALMETPEYLIVVQALAAIAPHIDPRSVTPRSGFETDLSLDSMHRVELLAEVEKRTGVMAPDDVYGTIETTGDLVLFLRARSIDRAPVTIEKMMSFKERMLDLSFFRVDLPEPESGLRRLFNALLRKAAGIFLRVSTQSAELLLDKNMPFIFIANHVATIDALLILHSLRDGMASKTFFLKEAIEYPRTLYAPFRRNGIALSHPDDPIETLKTSIAIVREGKNLILFPEGKISNDGGMASFRPGIGLLARETDARIVPLKITGHCVIRGESFSWSALVEKRVVSKTAAPQEIAAAIRARVAALSS
jgi:long-chain acyl-CoA synthetase